MDLRVNDIELSRMLSEWKTRSTKRSQNLHPATADDNPLAGD